MSGCADNVDNVGVQVRPAAQLNAKVVAGSGGKKAFTHFHSRSLQVEVGRKMYALCQQQQQ